MQTQKYVSKAVIIEAAELTKENADDVAKWCGGIVVTEIDAIDKEKTFVGINIPTIEGNMRASEGDYVIRGTSGGFYPCKPDVFLYKYEGQIPDEPLAVDSTVRIHPQGINPLDPGIREARIGDSLRARADAAARHIVGRSHKD